MAVVLWTVVHQRCCLEVLGLTVTAMMVVLVCNTGVDDGDEENLFLRLLWSMLLSQKAFFKLYRLRGVYLFCTPPAMSRFHFLENQSNILKRRHYYYYCCLYFKVDNITCNVH